MTLPLVYGPHVQDDVDEAYAWYEQQRAGLGEDYLGSVRETLNLIATNAKGYGVVHRRIRAATVRRFPYVIYYRIERSRILVIAIHHGHRDPSSWRRRTT